MYLLPDNYAGKIVILITQINNFSLFCEIRKCTYNLSAFILLF